MIKVTAAIKEAVPNSTSFQEANLMAEDHLSLQTLGVKKGQDLLVTQTGSFRGRSLSREAISGGREMADVGAVEREGS